MLQISGAYVYAQCADSHNSSTYALTDEDA